MLINKNNCDQINAHVFDWIFPWEIKQADAMSVRCE